MNKHIQIKNVHPALHKKLKIKAVESGLSLSDYLKRGLDQLAERPTNAEMLDRIRKLPTIELSQSPGDMVREDRDNR